MSSQDHMSFPHLTAAAIIVIASPPLRPHTNPRAVVEQRGQHEGEQGAHRAPHERRERHAGTKRT